METKLKYSELLDYRSLFNKISIFREYRYDLS